MYDPTTARWLSRDPIMFAGGDANLYRYVGNIPTKSTDPSGLQAKSLTPDQQQVLNMCNGDAACIKSVKELFEVLKNCGTYYYYPFASSDRCHRWRNDTRSKIIDAMWKRKLKDIYVHDQIWPYHGPILTFTDHGGLKVTLRNGKFFYLDNAFCGGSDDHIFFNIPESLQPIKQCPVGCNDGLMPWTTW